MNKTNVKLIRIYKLLKHPINRAHARLTPLSLRKSLRSTVLKSASVFVLLTLALTLPFFNAKQVFASEGDILAVRISGNHLFNGWVAEIDIEDMSSGGTYDMGFTPSSSPTDVEANAKIKFNVTSPGYDSNGNPTTINRTVYATNFLRQAYPNQNTPDETTGVGMVTVRVALSEFIHIDDTVTVDINQGFYTDGSTSNKAHSSFAVTNNSTNNYPKPVGRWAWPSFEKVKDNILLEAVVFHRSARESKPLASVKFTCTDEHSNSASQTVSNMTVSTRGDFANTGNKVLVYAATISTAPFTQGDVVTCNFIAYPWVGDSTSLLNSDLVANGGDGVEQPDDRLGPFAVLNDKDSLYGEPCAIVSSTGQASIANTWVYEDCATAELNFANNNTYAYADIGRAAQAIKSYNNANYGHNDPGGGTIELQAENYSTPGTAPSVTLGAQKTWLTIKPASNVPCHVPVINANSNDELMAQKLKYTCISTSTSSGNTFRGDVAYNDILWLDNMKLNSTEASPIRFWKTVYATNNTIDALTRGFQGIYGSADWPLALVRENNYTPLNSAIGAPLYTAVQTVIGNRNIRIDGLSTNTTRRHMSDNAIFAFNSIHSSDGSRAEVWFNSEEAIEFSHGIAFVQNVIENTAGAQPAIALSNLGGSDSMRNIIFWHNTVRGQRSNVAYATDETRCDQPMPFFINWTWKYNAESNNNRINEHRSDHGCPANGARIGNWSMSYMVGGAGNALAVGNAPAWSAPDYLGLYTVGAPANAGFVDDKSSVAYGGAGGGGGDYHLTESSSLRNAVPAGQAVLPFDLDGMPRLNNGSGALGAYEFDPGPDNIAPTITNFSAPTEVVGLTVSGIDLSATDNVAVTGYILTESPTTPNINDTGWQSTPPTSYTFGSYGSKTLYAWAKDASGNISTSDSLTITLTEPAPLTYSIGGTISGLAGSITIQNNGTDSLTASNGVFSFSEELTSGSSYAVTIPIQPVNQTCSVENGSGTVAGSDITNIAITCVANPELHTSQIDLSYLPTEDNKAESDVINKSIVIASSQTCYTFNNMGSRTLASSGIIAEEERVVILGGIGFRLDCSQSGGEALIELALNTHIANHNDLRVYKHFETGPEGNLLDITDQMTFTNKIVSGSLRTVVSYSINDGGSLDEDGAINGTIIDPIFVGLLQNSNTAEGSSSSATLADTGNSVHIALIASLIAISSGTILLRRQSRTIINRSR